jgi:hypothetical protein
MEIDLTTSSVVIAGKRLPAACFVCPQFEGQTDSEVERLIGGRAAPDKRPPTWTFVIPCENGVLIQIEWQEGCDTIEEITLDARTCDEWHGDPEGPLWLPHTVEVMAGRLVACPPRRPRGPVTTIPGATFYWRDAEQEWAVEHIERISAMEFPLPDGPAVRLITLATAERMLAEYG